MMDNAALERLCSEDTMREILEAMTPGQLCVAALRWDGMSDKEISAALGIGRAAVCARMRTARALVLARLPDLASTLGGRDKRPGRSRPKRVTREMRYEQLAEMALQGMAPQAMADELGLSTRMVLRYLHEVRRLLDEQQEGFAV